MRVTSGAAVTLAASLMVLSGCSTAGEDAPSVPVSTSTVLATQESADPDAGASGERTPAGPAASSDGGVDEIRDGEWQIGDAGTVEFTYADGRLSLGAITGADGWQHRVGDEQDDELTVHFANGAARWKFEVELDSEGMEISKEFTLTDADAGIFEVGDAGEVSFSGAADAVTMGEVTPREGWTVTSRDESSSSVEIEFRDDSGGKAEFEVESDHGALEVEISQKRRGGTPA